jgi:hypothetical protein
MTHCSLIIQTVAWPRTGSFLQLVGGEEACKCYGQSIGMEAIIYPKERAAIATNSF